MLNRSAYIRIAILVVAYLSFTTGVASAGVLGNPGFELDFGPREDLNMWGDYGETFGETYQVPIGKDNRPGKTREGKRVLIINVPQNTWNGIWQQVPWAEKNSYNLKGFYQIRGSDLPLNCHTSLKVEFYDGRDNKIGEKAGSLRTESTRGRWIADALRGVTPEGTESIKCVIIAGHCPDGPPVVDQIFWDDVDLLE